MTMSTMMMPPVGKDPCPPGQHFSHCGCICRPNGGAEPLCYQNCETSCGPGLRWNWCVGKCINKNILIHDCPPPPGTVPNPQPIPPHFKCPPGQTRLGFVCVKPTPPIPSGCTCPTDYRPFWKDDGKLGCECAPGSTKCSCVAGGLVKAMGADGLVHGLGCGGGPEVIDTRHPPPLSSFVPVMPNCGMMMGMDGKPMPKPMPMMMPMPTAFMIPSVGQIIDWVKANPLVIVAAGAGAVAGVMLAK